MIEKRVKEKNADIIIDFSEEITIRQSENTLRICSDILNKLCRQLSPRDIKNLSFINYETYQIFQSSSEIHYYLAFLCDQLLTVYEEEKDFPFFDRKQLIELLNCTGQELLEKTKRNRWVYHQDIDYFTQLMQTISEIEKKHAGRKMGLLAKIVFCGNKRKFEWAKEDNIAHDAQIWRKGRKLLAIFFSLMVVSSIYTLPDFLSQQPDSERMPSLFISLGIICAFIHVLIDMIRRMVSTGPSNPETPTCLLKDNQYLFFKPNPEPKMGLIAKMVYLNNNEAFEHAKRVQRGSSEISRYGRLFAFILFASSALAASLDVVGVIDVQPEDTKQDVVKALLFLLMLSIYYARKIVTTAYPIFKNSMENNKSLFYKINNTHNELQIEADIKPVNGLSRSICQDSNVT